MMLSGGLNLGKMRADRAIAEQAASYQTHKNLIDEQKLLAADKKTEIQNALAERKLTLQEARDAAAQVDRDAQIAVSQSLAATAIRNADTASRRADIADKNTRDANAPKPTTPAEQLKMDETIAGIEAAILSGEAGGKKLPAESLDAYVSLYNKNSKDTAYVKSVTKPKPLYEGSDRFWPGTGGEVTYSKVPKTQRIRVQSPDGKVGSVSAGSLQEALNSGYKQVD
jgi:hypothetical protein